MEGQLPHPPILGIQLNCAFKCLKLNQTSLMGLKIYLLATRYNVLLRPERSGDVPGSKVLSKDMRQKDAQPCCLLPHAIPAHHPVVLSLYSASPKGQSDTVKTTTLLCYGSEGDQLSPYINVDRSYSVLISLQSEHF